MGENSWTSTARKMTAGREDCAPSTAAPSPRTLRVGFALLEGACLHLPCGKNGYPQGALGIQRGVRAQRPTLRSIPQVLGTPPCALCDQRESPLGKAVSPRLPCASPCGLARGRPCCRTSQCKPGRPRSDQGSFPRMRGLRAELRCIQGDGFHLLGTCQGGILCYVHGFAESRWWSGLCSSGSHHHPVAVRFSWRWRHGSGLFKSSYAFHAPRVICSGEEKVSGRP